LIEFWENQMNVFVTGFEGYVGSHAVAALRAKGARVSALVRDAVGAEKADRLGVTPVAADLSKPATLVASVEAADAVAHFAASDNPAFLPVNTAAIDAMIGALRPGAVFATHGGTMVFGEQGRLAPATEPQFNPPPPLAGRAALDRHILEQARYGKRVHIIYGSFVFGGHGAMIPNAMADAAKATGSSAYLSGESPVWSGVHIEDWADLMARVIFSSDPGGTPVVAAAQDVRIVDAATALANAFQPPAPTRSVDIDEGRRLWPFFADGLQLYQRFAGNDAFERFGWKPEPRSLASAFEEAIAAGETPV